MNTWRIMRKPPEKGISPSPPVITISAHVSRRTADWDDLEVFYLFQMTMPGTPYIYYGDEIGMQTLDLTSKEGGYRPHRFAHAHAVDEREERRFLHRFSRKTLSAC